MVMEKNIENTESPKRNHIKIFLYLFCAVLPISIFVLWAIYFNGDKYEISNIVIRPSVQRFRRDFSKEIQTTRVFVERFINSYQDVIEEEVNPLFKTSFPLSKGRNIGAFVVFSTVSEAALKINPSAQNELICECTKYPVQMASFSGLDMIGSNVQLNKPYEEALKEYNSEKGFTVIHVPPSSVFIMTYMTFSSNYPKFFSFSKNSLVILVDVTMKMRFPDANCTIDMKPLTFITGENDFSFALDKADEYGQDFAHNQIRQLFETSEFFKMALLDQRLSPKAIIINQKYSRAEKDLEYKYPYWEFKKDVNELKGEAKANGIDASYIDDLLKYPSNQPKDGYLLRYYPNHFWFSVQWIVINIVLLVVFSIIVIVERTNCTVAVLMNKWWPNLFIRLSLNAILLSINAWVFLVEKPKDMNFKYWIIPGALFVACFLLTVLKAKGKKQNL
jgi:hypothetical protein